MENLTADEVELLSFFEVEPKRLDPDIAWPYNNFTYEVQLGQYRITFSISPAYKDLSFDILHNGAEIYKFSAQSVKDIRYLKSEGHEALEILITDRNTIRLQVRPFLSIKQNVSNET